MNEALLKKIVEYGGLYRKRYLTADPVSTRENYWDALVFFFSHLFYQGRRDDTSIKIQDHVIETLRKSERFFQNAWTIDELPSLRTPLQSLIGKGMIGKSGDIKMTLSALRYIDGLQGRNISKHAIELIEMNQIEKLYKELDNIFQVGDKIACFYLRDVVSLFGLEHSVDERFLVRLQPVDTWVRRVAAAVGLQANTDRKVQDEIISICRERGYSPILFNQGAWYMGYNAFGLLIDYLSKADE